MSRNQRFLCTILLMLFTVSILTGQEQPKTKPAPPPPPVAISPPGESAQAPPKESVLPAVPAPRPAQPKVATRTATVPSTLGQQPSDKTWCDVYILTDSPKDVLIFDKNGDMVQDARQVYIWFQIATNAPVAKIYRWPGLYRPASVQEENWDVRKLRVVDLQEFQRLAEDGRSAP
jgi:hypothetical protein